MQRLPVIEEEAKSSYVRPKLSYRLQFQAMASASVVSIAGGMKLAWSVFETPSGRLLTNSSTHLLAISWYMGVIIGVLSAAMFVHHTTKNAAHCTSGALLLCGGIISITFPTNFGAITSSCLCEGCAYGLTQVQALVTGGEVAHKSIRGLLLSGERIFLWLGICLQLLYTRIWYSLESPEGHTLHADQMQGILIACLGFMTIVLALVHRFESPLMLQLQQRELVSTDVIKRLEDADYTTAEVMRMSDECKQLLAYDAGENLLSVFMRRNALPLLKIMALRSFAALSLSLPLNRTFLTVSWSGFGCEMNCIYTLALCGLVGSTVGGFLLDAIGRRSLAVGSLFLSSIFIFVVGGIFQHLLLSQQGLCEFSLGMAACLMLLYQFVASAGICLASSVYMAEAFTLTVKAKCIAAVLVWEQLIYIALAESVFLTDYRYSSFFFCMGVLSLFLGVLVFFFMPETKHLPLSECLLKFK